VGQTEGGGSIAGRWIDNLLPDNDEVRKRWAGHFGETVCETSGAIPRNGTSLTVAAAGRSATLRASSP